MSIKHIRSCTAILAVFAGLLSGLGAVSPASAAARPAISAPAAEAPAFTSETAIPLAVANLGLNTAQAQSVQRWLHTYWGYNGAIDGQLGTNSWEAFQRCLKKYWGYTGAIDGIVGGGTVSALQRLLAAGWGYRGAIDGIVGPGTEAAFKNFANGI
ncbi:peptidoglycan-binding domain-containing protein [Catenulispora pinisilvae]|uniref:peptidoglycan-binding domain-containing protein n=1 Tax=Catenulispora pinisilvae TaxID=2705253 RepID=UPI0018922053|nr:peptidoglycan-binding protein [Catenulispora pinisilvae]